MRLLLFCIFACSLPAFGGEAYRMSDFQSYPGMCDASAAVAVSSNLFIVASDEDNILRLYRSDQPGAAIKLFDFNKFVDQDGKFREADIEGAARIGNRAFWIGSHGLNSSAKLRPTRRILFATDISTNHNEVVLTPVGRPYSGLLLGLFSDRRFSQFQLQAASQRAPKDPSALNIEGLSATPDGHLLLGFRNPIPQGKALLIPLLNPNEVINGTTPQFGDAILLDLGGVGVRDIALFGKTYIIIGGSYDAGRGFRLYQWEGPGHAPILLPVNGLDLYQPEGVVIYPDRGLRQFQILSDDGTRLIDGCQCKDLKDRSKQTFRAFWISP